MKLLITSLTPLSASLDHPSSVVHAAMDFRAAGHEVYVAAPVQISVTAARVALGAQALLPLFPTAPTAWGYLLLNAFRLAAWARRWRADIYLSEGGWSATLAHGARGATGGYGLSVLLLPRLRFLPASGLGAWIERRAIHECDRLVTDDPSLAETLVACYGARGADLALLPDMTGARLVALCDQFLAEPPAFR